MPRDNLTHWRDKHGVVHVPWVQGATHCHVFMEASVSEVIRASRYTNDPPTCLVCIVRSPSGR